MPEIAQTIVTRWADVDATHHLRHSAYADWATHMRTEWLNSHGFTLKRFGELKIAPILLEESTRYLKEIYLGESISIDLWLSAMTSDASRYHLRQHFRRGTAICAVYEIKGGWLDLATRKTAAPPPGLLDITVNLPRSEDFVELPASQRR